MGPAGTVTHAREFLTGFDIRRVKATSAKTFGRRLDEATEEMTLALPKGAQHWGSARKFFNIYVRGALYNRYLCQHFDLAAIEPWLEVPLDSHVAKGLLQEPEGDGLPRWKTVIGLERRDSDAYQAVASEVAKRNGIARVHLDVIYWRGDHLAAKKPAREG
jgi:hypothetical protein